MDLLWCWPSYLHLFYTCLAQWRWLMMWIKLRSSWVWYLVCGQGLLSASLFAKLSILSRIHIIEKVSFRKHNLENVKNFENEYSRKIVHFENIISKNSTFRKCNLEKRYISKISYTRNSDQIPASLSRFRWLFRWLSTFFLTIFTVGTKIAIRWYK